MTELEARSRIDDLKMAIKTCNRLHMDPFKPMYNNKMLLISIQEYKKEIELLEEALYNGEMNDSLDLKTRKLLYKEEYIDE